jgi:hypothetical protein
MKGRQKEAIGSGESGQEAGWMPEGQVTICYNGTRSCAQGPVDTVIERPSRPATEVIEPSSPMPSDWTIYLRAALREEDSAKLPQAVERARRAINDRLQGTGTKGPDTGEREELEDGLRQLNLHELKKKSAPH